MSKIIKSRRDVLKTAAVVGAGLSMPTMFTSSAFAGYRNEPKGSSVTSALTCRRPVHTPMKVRTNFALTCWLPSTQWWWRWWHDEHFLVESPEG